MLARQVLFHLSHAPGPFCFSLFLDRVLCFCLAGHKAYFSFRSSWDYRHESPSLVCIDSFVVRQISVCFSVLALPN
jgi:hypothetical protein